MSCVGLGPRPGPTAKTLQVHVMFWFGWNRTAVRKSQLIGQRTINGPRKSAVEWKASGAAPVFQLQVFRQLSRIRRPNRKGGGGH